MLSPIDIPPLKAVAHQSWITKLINPFIEKILNQVIFESTAHRMNIHLRPKRPKKASPSSNQSSS